MAVSRNEKNSQINLRTNNLEAVAEIVHLEILSDYILFANQIQLVIAFFAISSYTTFGAISR